MKDEIVAGERSARGSERCPRAGTRALLRGVLAAAVTAAVAGAIAGAAGAEGSYSWPLSGRVIAAYASESHRGIDIQGQPGTAVSAAEAGTVSYAAGNPRGGVMLTVDHPDGFSTTYLGLAGLKVARGSSVGKGEAIGILGSVGDPSSDVPHLHLGAYRTASRTDKDYADPQSLLGPLPVQTAESPQADPQPIGQPEPSRPAGNGAVASPTPQPAPRHTRPHDKPSARPSKGAESAPAPAPAPHLSGRLGQVEANTAGSGGEVASYAVPTSHVPASREGGRTLGRHSLTSVNAGWPEASLSRFRTASAGRGSSAGSGAAASSGLPPAAQSVLLSLLLGIVGWTACRSTGLREALAGSAMGPRPAGFGLEGAA